MTIRSDGYYSRSVIPKSWYMSKTVWTNILLGIIGGVAAVSDEGVVTEDAVKALVLVGAISNLLLRYLTDRPIKLR
jgi:Zn-dependent protease